MLTRTSEESGRGGRIRTGDPLRPRQVRYQAALRPDRDIYDLAIDDLAIYLQIFRSIVHRQIVDRRLPYRCFFAIDR